jgi:hypothetical protein
MEEAGSGHEDSSHNILTLVLSRSQVTLELPSPYADRLICKAHGKKLLGNLADLNKWHVRDLRTQHCED